MAELSQQNIAVPSQKQKGVSIAVTKWRHHLRYKMAAPSQQQNGGTMTCTTGIQLQETGNTTAAC